MRRPTKPFVTEYKGANRRQSPASQSLKIDAEPATPRVPEPRHADVSRSLAASSEDSYEAALRAADALFAPAPRSASAPSTPAPWSAEPPTAGATDSPPEPLSRDDTSPAVGTPSPATNGGRILRVIDEPPSPELLRLEAERAPKRRGRKPGSKNKPKTPVVVEAAIPALASSSADQAVIVATAERAVVAPEPASGIRPVNIRHVRRPPAARPAPEATRDGKYAWVRTKLKPGERWKRRLPKVAW